MLSAIYIPTQTQLHFNIIASSKFRLALKYVPYFIFKRRALKRKKGNITKDRSILHECCAQAQRLQILFTTKRFPDERNRHQIFKYNKKKMQKLTNSFAVDHSPLSAEEFWLEK